nr:hypothetical protein [Tanacetum cinerariifolium]
MAIGDIVPVQSAAGRKIRRTVVIEDSESNQLDCTFWDHWGNIFKELPEYGESQFKISLFTPQKPMVTVAEFFHEAVKKMVSSICECEQIHRIQKENGWAYTGCKKCNKKFNVVESKASSSNGKNKVTFYCEDDGVVQVAS